ncbi:hypothetical protein B5P46_02865 [Rhizobium leguminosarum]|uniref:Uncharacterized protein n=1 Tax=Rhizobium leguminosarum TaxID=384 RepID=A0A4V1P372_RHILE|nr:hypothetical protein [Rhizobium leguminosarum]RXT30010.1 hypothetical protein B5P46_02865 [Rhizobium leguminosarum]
MSGSAVPALKAIGIPTLFLRGEDDQIVPIRINVDRSVSWYRNLMVLTFSLAMAPISLAFQEL